MKISKKSSFLFLSLHYFLSAFSQPSDTVWVDKNFNVMTPGWDTICFSSIQHAVNTVAEQGVVLVGAGNWEETVQLYGGISLIGESKESTIITKIEIFNTGKDGQSRISNMTLDFSSEKWDEPSLSLESACNVMVDNIHLTHQGIAIGYSHHNTFQNILLEGYGSIRLAGGSQNIIRNNELRSVIYPSHIWITENSHHNTIENNIITGIPGNTSCTAIRSVYCSNNIIRNNTSKNFRVHILLTYSNGNIVNGNTMSGMREPHEENGGGIVIYSGNNNALLNNTIDSVSDAGILLFGGSTNNLLQANKTSDTRHGIEIYYNSNHNQIINNNIKDHKVGIILDNASNNLLYENNILNCALTAFDDDKNSWHFNGSGNYWGEDVNERFCDSGYMVLPSGFDNSPANIPFPVIIASESEMVEDTVVRKTGQIFEIKNDSTIVNEKKNILESYIIRNNAKLVLDQVEWNAEMVNNTGFFILVDSGGYLGIKNSKIFAMGGVIEGKSGSRINIEKSELNGFGSWDGNPGLSLSGNETIIKDNIIRKSYVSITLQENSSGAQIINNRISESQRGIIGNSSRNVIEGNTIFDIIASGIRADLYNSEIRNNTFRDIWLKTIVTNKMTGNEEDASRIYRNNFFSCAISEIHELDLMSYNNKGNFYSDYLDRYPDAKEHSEYPGIWNKAYAHLTNNPDRPQPKKNDNFPLMYPVNLDSNIIVPQSPKLLYPDADAADIPFDTVFRWNSVEHSNTYRVQISLDEDFNEIFFNKGAIADTILEIQNLDEWTIYYWRVLADNSGVISKWSEVQSFITEGITSTEIYKDQSKMGNSLQLRNYPNPFREGTTIHYELPESSNVSIKIYNQMGQLVRTLVNQHQIAGHHSIIWQGKNDNRRTISTGEYTIIISTNLMREASKATFIH